MGGCATPGRHSTRCRSCRLPRALMLNGFAVQEFRLVYNNEGAALGNGRFPGLGPPRWGLGDCGNRDSQGFAPG